MFHASTPESRAKARIEARAIGVAQRDLAMHLGAVAAHVGAYVRANRATPYIAAVGFIAAVGSSIGWIESITL